MPLRMRRPGSLAVAWLFGSLTVMQACGDTTDEAGGLGGTDASDGDAAQTDAGRDDGAPDANSASDGNGVDASDASTDGTASDAPVDAPTDVTVEAALDASVDADASDGSACTPFLAAAVTASVDIQGGVCAIDKAGDLYCWDLARDFPGKNAAKPYVPTKVTGISAAKSVAFGRSSVFVVFADGTVQAWGDNDCGQLGDGTKTNRYTLGAVSGLTQAKTIVGSQYGSMYALNKDGTAASWGDVNVGTCALDSKQWTPTPFLVAGVSPVAIAEPDTRGCALLPDKTVACWNGLLTYTASAPAGYRPATTTAISGLTDVAEIGTHYGNPSPGVDACARNNDGTVACWLGTGAASAVSAFGSAVARLSSGWRNDCALRTDGSLHCWGPNSGTYFEGMIGDGTSTDRSSPVQVTSLGTDVAQISVGMRTACVVKKDDTLWCWGYRPGTGTSGVELAPVQIMRCP